MKVIDNILLLDSYDKFYQKHYINSPYDVLTMIMSLNKPEYKKIFENNIKSNFDIVEYFKAITVGSMCRRD